MSPHDWLGGQALTFARPWLLLLLLLIPLLAWLRGRFGPRAAIIFSATAPFRAIGKGSANRAGQILRALVWLALAAFIVGIARPQLGKSLLDAVREVTRKFIEARPNDRIGMIAFGTRPYIVSPMTLDHEWLLQNLDRVRIGLVEGSTAIGSAMAAAGNRLNDKQSKSRVIVLLTDGDNNAGKIPPNTAAEALKALRIHLYAIGIGTNGVAPFPVMDERTGRVVTDGRGNVYYQNAPVSFNETGLREVAQIADGKFYRATDTESLASIYQDIDKLEKTTISARKYQQYRDLFPVCIAAGCGLLIGQLLLGQTVWRRLP